MTLQYRICHNCGATLTPDQAFCPRCGAQYVESVFQEPVVSSSPQGQVPYQQQGQGYASPPTPPPGYPSHYGQQAPMTPGQVGGSPQPPPTQPTQGISPFLIIAIVVVVLLLLVGTGGLFYHLGQENGTQPGTTPTPGITPVATPTQGSKPVPTPTPTQRTTPVPTPTSIITPGTTPTATSFRIFIHYDMSGYQ
jgi:hypothetical protein